MAKYIASVYVETEDGEGLEIWQLKATTVEDAIEEVKGQVFEEYGDEAEYHDRHPKTTECVKSLTKTLRWAADQYSDITIYQIVDTIDVSMPEWVNEKKAELKALKAKIEQAKERKEYERLKAKYG